ncbi:MAG: hypothetical protein A2X46_16615 [Lentisphaerae bacterium GWF2_57_35]|nr:MAG: hypothetical protein A2X46_16615 [Lentisphaerae bacterium GWF2_57_35]
MKNVGWIYRNAAALGAVMTGVLFLAVVHNRILSYVCGNDPMLYIRAAKVLLNPSWYGMRELMHSLTFVAPGYPAILAAAIKLFGPLAPYWVNLVLLTATLPLLWYVLRRLTGTDRAAAFALLGLLIIVFRGHEFNAPAMLYPFREPARLFFVFGSYALLLMGLKNGIKRSLVLAAGFSSLAACLVREPSILAAPGILIGLLGLTNSWRSRFRAGAWFLVPWGVAAILLLAVIYRYAFHGSQQMAVVKYLTDTHGAMIRGRQLLAMFPAEAGWLGLGLIGIGMVRAIRRAPLLWAWFLLPAVLFFVFHCFMQVHVRYFLTSLLFLSVFAGYGLDGLVSLAGRFKKGERWEKLATILCVAVMAATMVQTAWQAHPWEPRVTSADVREWQAWVQGLPKGPEGRTRVVVEQRCRYMEDLMNSYTDVELLDARDMESWPSTWAPAVYFQPMNRHAEYPKPEWLFNKKIYAHRIMADRLDLLPFEDFKPVVRTIGQGTYAPFTVRSWQAGRHDQKFTTVAHSDQVVWIDWGACRPDVERTVAIRNAQSGRIWFTRTMTGNGLQAVFLPAESVDGTEAVFSSESSAPAPSNPVIDVARLDHPVGFSFGVDRLVSVNRWFPSLSGDNLELRPVSLSSEKPVEFTAPILYSSVEAYWEVSFYGDRHEGKTIPVYCNVVDKEPHMGDLASPSAQDAIRTRSGKRVEISMAPETHATARLANIQFRMQRYE